MITRTITIQAQPSLQIVLFFDSRSNAEKALRPHPNSNHLMAADDYGQVVQICKDDVIISDLIVDLKEFHRAQGEQLIVQARAQMEFDKRLDADKVLKTHFDMVKARQAARGQIINPAQIRGQP